MNNAWLFLGGLMILPGMGMASVFVVYLIFRRPSKIERNRGGVMRYKDGDRVVIAYLGVNMEGVIKRIARAKQGQSPMQRIATVQIEWTDGLGGVHRKDVPVQLWLIKGRVIRQRRASLQDTSWHFAQEKWLVKGPRKEQAG